MYAWIPRDHNLAQHTYVGYTSGNLKHRISGHAGDAERKIRDGTPIHAFHQALLDLGPSAFVVIPLEQVPVPVDGMSRAARNVVTEPFEKKWIAILNTWAQGVNTQNIFLAA